MSPTASTEDTVFEDQRTIVVRALRDGRPVLLRALKDERPPPEAVARLHHGALVARELDLPGVVRVLGVEARWAGPAQVLEDTGARPLLGLFGGGGPQVITALDIALRVARVLAEVHARGVVHKNIGPASIWVDRRTGDVKITDFDIASRLPRELPPITGTGRIEGTLAYVAPEQTGRMNRAVDLRADFYALGVTLYEMLTGRLPFTATDPAAIVHAHLAVLPEPPQRVRPTISAAVSAVVMMLLAKRPEDRYQSATGLALDLEECVRQYKATGTVVGFVPGEHDAPEVFLPSQRRYGRDRERAELAAAFARAAGGAAEIVLLSGPPGAGKSTLARELARVVVERRGTFAAGRADPVVRVPFGALASARDDAVRQALAEPGPRPGLRADEPSMAPAPDGRAAALRGRILGALGGNARVLADVVPELGRLVGPEETAPALGAPEAGVRFDLALRRLVETLATREQPLVLFVDDLDRADAASLGALRRLLADPTLRHFLFVGALEADDAPALAEIRQGAAAVTGIAVGPLALGDAARLVADSLRCTPGEAEGLAAAMHGAEPGRGVAALEIHQRLLALHEEKLLTFDPAGGRFRWDAAEVRRRAGGCAVEARVHALPEAARRALATAARLGGSFDLATLALVEERSLQRMGADLQPALERGLLVTERSASAYRHLAVAEAPEPVTFAFCHDLVREAAAAIDPAPDAEVHLRIARRIREGLPDAERGARIFEIAGHLGRAAERLATAAEREDLARICLDAGLRAEATAAYDLAHALFDTGAAALGEAGWETAYDLARPLHLGRALCASLGGRDDEGAGLAEVLGRSRRAEDRARVHGARMAVALARGRRADAARAADEGLLALGCEVPEDEAALAAAVEAASGALAARLAVGHRPGLRADEPRSAPEPRGAHAEEAPPIDDPRTQALLRLLGQAVVHTTEGAPARLELLAARLAALDDRGATPEGAIGCAVFARARATRGGGYDLAYGIGAAALAAALRLGDGRAAALVRLHFGAYVLPWRERLRAAFPLVDQAYEGCLDHGLLDHAAAAAVQGTWLRMLSGEDLFELRERARGLAGSLRRLGRREAAEDLEACDRAAAMLTRGEAAGETHPVFAAQAALLLGDPARALAEATRGAGLAGHVIDVARRFYQCLAALALPDPGLDLIEEGKAALDRAAAVRPESFRQRVLLVDAERARVEVRDADAMDLYDRAIQAAADAEILPEEGLACELAARFYAGRGRRRIAQAYFVDARSAYVRWGADAKVARLDQARAELVGAGLAGPAPAEDHRPRDDAGSAARALQAIAGEVVFEDLARTLMSHLVEGSGAERGFLVIEGDREVVVEAGGAAGVTVHRGPLERRTDLAQSIVRYVQRTRERVVLGDAGGSGQFPGDPYVAAARPRSILCVPVGPDTSAPVSSRSGGALSRPPPPSSGVLYLENNRIANAFGAERCRFVELCAAHAAVALRNARRFEALERRVEERSRELAKSDEAALSAERRLKEAQQQLLVQERLASLGQLTAGIVHEIKNPLNFVSNFAELSVALADEIEEGVRAGRLDGLDEALDDLRQNLSRIRDHGKRANDIIHGMLLHARAPTGGREEVDINALLANSVSLAYHGMRGRMRGFDVTVDAAYDPSIGPMKVASSELSQVFVNVIDNACYAMQKKAQAMDGAYAPRLTIRTKNLGEMAEVRIRDNGTGIPADVVGRIFRPFFTTKPTGEGTGLGLSVSHDIVVEGHHGEMRVESVPGEHTEFVIALPRRDRR